MASVLINPPRVHRMIS
nr:unnamed protein product [Callosobruchus analis]